VSGGQHQTARWPPYYRNHASQVPIILDPAVPPPAAEVSRACGSHGLRGCACAGGGGAWLVAVLPVRRVCLSQSIDQLRGPCRAGGCGTSGCVCTPRRAGAWRRCIVARRHVHMPLRVPGGSSERGSTTARGTGTHKKTGQSGDRKNQKCKNTRSQKSRMRS